MAKIPEAPPNGKYWRNTIYEGDWCIILYYTDDALQVSVRHLNLSKNDHITGEKVCVSQVACNGHIENAATVQFLTQREQQKPRADRAKFDISGIVMES